MKEPEKPAEAEVAEGETETPADGKEAAPVTDGDKKENDEKKIPEKKLLKKKNNQIIKVKIPKQEFKKICFYL